MAQKEKYDLLAQARSALEQHQTEDAQGILVNLVVSEPQNEDAWFLLANTFDDMDRRMECLQHARKLNPQSATIATAIQQVKAEIAGALFGTEAPAAVAPQNTPAPGKNPQLAQILLEAANHLAQATLMTTDPVETRDVGSELIHLLDRAQQYDGMLTRRWANTAGRAALVKYEKALTHLLSNIPQNAPQLAPLREQRQHALDLFK